MARLRAAAQAVAAAAEARYALEAFVLAELDAASEGTEGSEGWRGLLLAEEEWLWEHENATVVRAHSRQQQPYSAALWLRKKPTCRP